MKKVGIVGVSGYSGLTALEILFKHPEVEVSYVSANNTKGPLEEVWPQLKGKTDLICDTFDLNKAIESCDLIFLAVPHTVSMQIVPQLLQAQKSVIDISADYRLKDPKVFEAWYKTAHSDPKNLSEAVYGLPELHREKIKKATLVANPGCYPTAAILALAPIVATHTGDIQSIIIDAKSGISGAGRKFTENYKSSGDQENFKAYKVLNHQHTPEIDQYLSQLANKKMAVTFTPHLLPVDRGILETIYVQLKKPLAESKALELYKRFYKTEKFVRVLNESEQPELKNVVGTNYCDIGLAANEKTLVITAAIDNLVKGASGQAVQNMNIMYNFKEEEALL